MSKNLFITLDWDKSYTLLVAPISGRFAVDQNHVGFDLQPATTEALGGVIVGKNLVITDAGELSAVGEGVAGVSSFNQRVGDITLTEKDVSDALGFRPANYKLPVATEKTLGGVKQGKNVTIADDGSISADVEPTPYELPIASKETLGGIKVGKNLSVDEDGTLNAEGSAPVDGVTTFNNRKGDVKLTKKDVTDVVNIPAPYDLPVASEKTLGGVKVGHNLEVKEDGTINALDQHLDLRPATKSTLGGIIVGDNLTITEDGVLSATGGEGGGVISFNGREGRVKLTSKDVSDVQEIASKASLGVVKVGKNLTVHRDGTIDAELEGEVVTSFNGRTGGIKLTAEDLDEVQEIASKTSLGVIKVGRNLTIEADGTLNAEGGSDAGVSTFNGRSGAVELTAKDVTDVVDIPDPYSLPIASENALGGIKVGDNLTIGKDGRLNAQSGGGQGASHRLIMSDDDATEWTNYNLKKSDLNGFVSVLTDSYIPAAIILPLDVYASEGCQIDITNLNGDVGIFSADANNLIFNRDYYNMVKEGGTAKLIYLGEDIQTASGVKLKSIANGQKFWLLIGDLTDEEAYVLSKPSFKSAIAGDSKVTISLDLPDEKVPVLGYDFDANGADGSWKHYSFCNDGRGEVVLDGLTNMVEYTINYNTFATCGDSPTSEKIKITPTGRRPDAPTLIGLEGHWNGAKVTFNEPADKSVKITGWLVKDGEGKTYPLENVTGESGEVHTGWFAALEEKMWEIAIAGKNENGVGEFTPLCNVYIGARQFNPTPPQFDSEASVSQTVGWLAPDDWGLEDGFTSINVIADDLNGRIEDRVMVNYPKDAKKGVTGKLQFDHKYNLCVRGVYPNGDTSDSAAVQLQMWPHYVKEAPKDVTIDATGKDAIFVTINDPIKPPCTGFEVWIDGHVVASEKSGYKTTRVVKGYTGGVECLIQVRWIEIDNQFSDLDAGKKVTPFAPAPNVPELGYAEQNADKVTLRFFKNTEGAEATQYFLMTRMRGDSNWLKMDVTSAVLADKPVSFTPRVDQTRAECQYCGSAKNSGGESAFSDPRGLICDPYMKPDAPQGAFSIVIREGSLIVTPYPEKFVSNDQQRHFTGIIVKSSVNGSAPTVTVKPVDWKGSDGDWYGANVGQTLSISFAAQTWGSVEGYFSDPIVLNRTQ